MVLSPGVVVRKPYDGAEWRGVPEPAAYAARITSRSP